MSILIHHTTIFKIHPIHFFLLLLVFLFDTRFISIFNLMVQACIDIHSTTKNNSLCKRIDVCNVQLSPRKDILAEYSGPCDYMDRINQIFTISHLNALSFSYARDFSFSRSIPLGVSSFEPAFSDFIIVLDLFERKFKQNSFTRLNAVLSLRKKE